MGFGGSASAMINSIKDNRSLVRGRNHLFDRPVSRSYGNGEALPERPPVSASVRDKFREKLAQEKRNEYKKWAWTISLTILLCFILWNYGLEIIDLIVYQPGTP